MKPKTVHEHLYRLKKMTKRAVSQGTLRRDPYGKLHPELPRRKSRHLKLEDLKKLMETPVDKPNLQRVRDWFLFATFTGLSYADLKRLSEKRHHAVGRRNVLDTHPAPEDRNALGHPPAERAVADHREIPPRA